MSQVATSSTRTTGHSDSHLAYQNQYVSFLLDGQLLGIPVRSVQEVLNPQTIANTPRSRNEIAGLLNLRGQIVTAVNLRKRMGLADKGPEDEYMNVVVIGDGESFSLLVDEVGDVMNIPSEKIEAVPSTLDPTWKSVTVGVSQLEDRLLIILDVDAVLDFV